MGKRGRENERTRQQLENADHILELLKAVNAGYTLPEEVEARAQLTAMRRFDNAHLRRGRESEQQIADIIKKTPGVTSVIHIQQNSEDDNAGRDIQVEGVMDGQQYSVYVQVKSSKEHVYAFLRDKKKKLGVEDIRAWLLAQKLIMLYAGGNEEWTRNKFLKQVHAIQEYHATRHENS